MHAHHPIPQARAAAFTLMEILIVVGIIALLSSMAMPILTVAQSAAKKTATRSVMHKVDTALHLFKTDIGAFPYQRTYADTSIGERPDNRLYHHLGTTLTATEVQNLHVDANAAAAQYQYICKAANGSLAEQPPVSPHVFRIADTHPSPATNGDGPAWRYENIGGGVFDWVHYPRPGHYATIPSQMAMCVMLNRMGAERARLAVWSGNVDVKGCRIQDAMHPLGAVFKAGRDNSALELLAAKATDAKPGWGSDYLKGELEKRYIDGETILDAWKRPLAYVCQTTEGMRSTRGFVFVMNLRWIDSRLYGLEKQGRRTLAPVDPFTGEPTTADGSFLPDPANLRDSDRRRWAAPGLEHTFELWSAGPDGRFDWMRLAPGNTDNVSLEPYDKEIPQ